MHYLCIVSTTALVSYITYLFIERPGIIFGKRLIARIESSSVASGAISDA
jgi:hypothetical protein